MFTCFIRYTVDPKKINEFKEYAYSWIELIEEYGGTHHGYFHPGEAGDELPDPTFSFPDLGTEGPPNIGVALFSFPNLEKYEFYKREVADDDRCKYATKRFNETQCFSSYERTFLKPLFSRNQKELRK